MLVSKKTDILRGSLLEWKKLEEELLQDIIKGYNQCKKCRRYKNNKNKQKKKAIKKTFDKRHVI